MEFNKNIKEDVEKAKEILEKMKGLSEKEKEILFGKMIDKILEKKDVETHDKDDTKDNSLKNSQDIQELYHQNKPKSSTDLVTLIAYYYHKKGNNFTAYNILENFKLLLIPAPKNPSDLINKNRAKGFILIAEKDSEKNNLFSITRDGISYIEGGYKLKK